MGDLVKRERQERDIERNIVSTQKETRERRVFERHSYLIQAGNVDWESATALIPDEKRNFRRTRLWKEVLRAKVLRKKIVFYKSDIIVERDISFVSVLQNV